MAKGRRGRDGHPPEVKAAVMSALMAGQGVTETARQYNLSHQVVSSWKSQLSPEKVAEAGRKKGEILDALIFDVLQESLKALAAMARASRSDVYVSKQPANELAILYGVMADKAVRILEAHEAAFGESEPVAASTPA